jgi:hypothetical protein
VLLEDGGQLVGNGDGLVEQIEKSGLSDIAGLFVAASGGNVLEDAVEGDLELAKQIRDGIAFGSGRGRPRDVGHVVGRRNLSGRRRGGGLWRSLEEEGDIFGFAGRGRGGLHLEEEWNIGVGFGLGFTLGFGLRSGDPFRNAVGAFGLFFLFLDLRADHARGLTAEGTCALRFLAGGQGGEFLEYGIARGGALVNTDFVRANGLVV